MDYTNQTEVKSGELVITRIFNAPRERVWKAWTEPDQVMKWWGPKTFTCPAVKMDFRVGGKYLFCMRDTSGKDFWSTGVYEEIVKPERIVVTDSFADEKGNVVSASYYGLPGDFPKEMRVVVSFEDLKGKTKLILRHIGMPTAGDMSKMAGQGWNEQFDKLDELLK